MIISLLLKKALPFALTFIFGAALSGFVGLFGSGKTHVQYHVGEYGSGRRECRMRSHKLVAESKALVINFQPDARLLLDTPGNEGLRAAIVRVTFGADGRIQDVAPLKLRFRERGGLYLVTMAAWEAADHAARQIEFTPETVDGVPVTVTRDVEIRFMAD